MNKNLTAFLLFVSMLIFTATEAFGQNTAEVLYEVENLGGGRWQYDYTLFNNLDPNSFSGYDLYDVTLDFEPSATLNVLAPGNGWSSVENPGSVQLFSLSGGAPPIGFDIAPGSSLGGFQIEFDYQAGSIPFTALFSNPADPFNPLRFDGFTAPLAPVAVPEPGTLALFGVGLGCAIPTATLLLRQRRAR